MNKRASILKIFSKPISAFFTVFAAGSLSALAMAPFNLWLVLFFTLPCLYLGLVQTKDSRRAFGIGFLFALGYFTFSLYWIGNALLVEGNPYKWAWPLAVLGLPAVLALFWGLAALCAHKFLNLKTVGGWLGFCGIFCAAEFLRGVLFTGFPWNLFGYAWADILPLLQILKFSDVYMLTVLTWLWASSPALFSILPPRKVLIATGCSIGLFVILIAWGAYHLHTTKAEAAHHANIQIKIIQPNIDQAEKWNRDKLIPHFERHLELSRNQEKTEKITYIIWPETAFSYRLANDPVAILKIKETLATYKQPAYIFTGMLRADLTRRAFYNSLVMIDQSGTIRNIYDKHHLVPFGEYMPLPDWIPLPPIVQMSGFQTGPGEMNLKTDQGIRYAPQVCYEIIFPHARIFKSLAHPDFILTVTNDAWYGKSPGPYQHFTKAKFRAIENGVPVIRSANTGISGLIDSSGHIIGQTDLYTEDTQLFDLPMAVEPALSHSKKFIAFIALLLCLIGFAVTSRFIHTN